MSKNIDQVYIANPITVNAATDLMYFGQSPYGAGNDAAMLFSNFKSQFALSSLTSAHIYVGNGSNIAASVAMGGDATIDNTGAVTVSKIGGKAVTLGGSLTLSGAFATTFTITAGTSVTFPTSGTLATTTGTVTNATNAANVATTQVATNASFFPLFVASSTNGNQACDLGTGLTFNPSSNTLTTTTFSGALSGNATNITGIAAPANGGTGVANSGNLTWGGAVTFSGAFTTTFTVTAGTSVTLPTSGTLATTAQLNFPTWNDVSGTSQAAAVNNGYIISNAGQTTVTLPATAAEGSVVAVQGKGAAGWVLTANTGQTIKLGSSTTSSAGSLTSTNQWDGITVVCVTANTTWAAHSVIGNLTVT